MKQQLEYICDAIRKLNSQNTRRFVEFRMTSYGAGSFYDSETKKDVAIFGSIEEAENYVRSVLKS